MLGNVAPVTVFSLYSRVFSYSRALRNWARRITGWARGAVVAEHDSLIDKPVADGRKRDVFVYFDNDAKVRAPFDAMALQAKIEHARALQKPARVS